MTIRPPTSEMGIRPPTSEFLLRHTGSFRADPLDIKPEVSIRPSFKMESRPPFKIESDESGALNLSKGSEGWSPPPVSPDTQRPSPPRSPQGYRPPTYTSMEICVVCGDRASGKYRVLQKNCPKCFLSTDFL